MEVSEEIHKVLISLKNTDSLLSNNINEKKIEIDDLKLILEETKEKINVLENELSEKENKIIELKNTISETEKGYNKIIDAGETLMAIINQNISNLDII
tara:strand:- start:2334 stop:2630 length:297 start_codon:yes stop_codon:yes gene_type:complete